MISNRRFLARPLLVLLESIGVFPPWPTGGCICAAVRTYRRGTCGLKAARG